VVVFCRLEKETKPQVGKLGEGRSGEDGQKDERVAQLGGEKEERIKFWGKWGYIEDSA